MPTRYVNCLVSLGMFDHELYVIVNDSAAYVSKNSVKVEGGLGEHAQVKGSVLAYVVEEQQDKALIQLPGEPVVGGLRTWVGKDRLVAV